jgi:PiT family inorganic phosphate transporter
MNLKEYSRLEKKSTAHFRVDFTRLGAAILFMIVVFIYASIHAGGIETGPNGTMLLVIAALIGAYMAMNIGANDVANNVGPTVGSQAITLAGAIAIAALFEAMGAIIAGGNVVSTIKSGIIDPAVINDANIFVWVMISALLAAALWLNLATAVGAPVSTTHSIVGAVMGGGIAAGGWALVNWSTVGSIVASWVVSPALGGLIAAFFLYSIKRTITYQEQMAFNAGKRVPFLVAIMAWAFGGFMLVKGLGDIYKMAPVPAVAWSFLFAVGVYLLVRGPLARAAAKTSNTKEGVNSLFTLPLICAAALLSFAHGANDVANAIGPLAAIYEALSSGEVATKAAIPLWIMIIGALGLAVGLALYGPKLIKTVGSEITDLDRMRAFSIAIAAAITVIVAAELGLPISTTHVTIGAVFGVGFLREYLKGYYARMEAIIREAHSGEERERVEAYLERFKTASLKRKGQMLQAMKKKAAKKAQVDGKPISFSKRERKAFKKVYENELVKRSLVYKIIAAWIITLPAAALLSALLFWGLSTLFV